jgi:hypothetical protein
MAVGREPGMEAWRKPLQAAAAAVALGLALALPVVAQQEAQPPVQGQEIPGQPQATQPTPSGEIVPGGPLAAPASPTLQPAAAAPAEFAVGAPHLQAIAQGLVTIDGPVVWRVREITLTPSGFQEYYPASFLVQRSGVGIVRNDFTAHRVRIESGEAAFLQNGEPFTPLASGVDPSVGWVIELMPQAASAAQGSGLTLLASDAIADYPPGIYDLELQRAVLLPGEVSDLPPHTGPALVMISAGRVQVSALGEAPLPAAAGDGLLAPGALTIRNGDAQPAAFLVALLGDRVDDAQAAAPGQDGGFGQALPTQPPLMQTPVPVPPTAPPQSLVPTPPPIDQPVAPPVAPTPVPEMAGDSDGDGVSDDIELQMGTDPYNQDFDGDGLIDGDEVYTFGTDPSNNDSDADGLLDGEEATSFGTSPTALDSDGDSVADADEIYVHGTEPMTWDTDGDGISDGEEVYILGTDALDPSSGP